MAEDIYYLKTLRKGLDLAAVAAGKPEWLIVKVKTSNVALYLEDENDKWEQSNEQEYDEWLEATRAYKANVKASNSSNEETMNEEVQAPESPVEEVAAEAASEASPEEAAAPAEEAAEEAAGDEAQAATAG